MVDGRQGGGRARPDRAQLGRAAETIVCAWLRRRGYRILGRNVRVKRLEIDIIAQAPAEPDEPALAGARVTVFCEVRARRRGEPGVLLESIDPAKVARLREAAGRWLAAAPQQRRRLGAAVRFDAAAVSFDGDRPCVTYVPDAF